MAVAGMAGSRYGGQQVVGSRYAGEGVAMHRGSISYTYPHVVEHMLTW